MGCPRFIFLAGLMLRLAGGRAVSCRNWGLC